MAKKIVNHYSPIVEVRNFKGRGIADKTFKLIDGERHKHCSCCDDYHPADTGFFTTASTKCGLNAYCRCCEQERRNEIKYWLKASQGKL